MQNPGTPGAVVPPGDDWIARELYDLRHAVERNAAARTLESSSIGSGGIRSEDFNGTGPTNPGTTGWMIGRVAGGESYMIINGLLIFDYLLAQDALIAAQQATLTTQQAYLASLISKDTTLAGFNTGTLINDATIHYVGATASLTIAVPTGKLRVIVSCPEASVNPGTGTPGGVEAYLSFSLAGPTPVAMGTYTSRVYTSGPWIGATLDRIKTVTLTPGTYTVTIQAGYFCSGYAAASINFAGMDLSAEVVNGS